MMHSGAGVRIETARLVLREFVLEDWPAVLAYQSDPRYLRYYAWESRTPAEVQAFVAMFISYQHATPRTRYQLAIERRDAPGTAIGNCGVRLSAPGSRVADIGYELAPDQWGQGFATEAARAILVFGFDALQVHRIAATVVADNTASARVLTKLGLRQEGLLRENEYFKGRWWDTALFGILAEEWQVQQGSQ